MAGIGPDIEEVIEELGVVATILRTPTNLTEKLIYEVSEQATNAFVREHYLNASTKYNSVILSGDVVQFEGSTYIVSNKTPDMFEGGIVEHLTVLLKCNNVATFVYPVSTKDPVTFAITQAWQYRLQSGFILLYPSARGVQNNPGVTDGKERTYRYEGHVPASYNIQIHDRVWITDTEYYRVQDIERYAYPGVHILQLVEDDRGVSVIPIPPPVVPP